MIRTNDLRGKVAFLEDLLFLATQAFINDDDAGLIDAMVQMKAGADIVLSTVQGAPKK